MDLMDLTDVCLPNKAIFFMLLIFVYPIFFIQFEIS